MGEKKASQRYKDIRRGPCVCVLRGVSGGVCGVEKRGEKTLTC